jgi:hypothetical protein
MGDTINTAAEVWDNRTDIEKGGIIVGLILSLFILWQIFGVLSTTAGIVGTVFKFLYSIFHILVTILFIPIQIVLRIFGIKIKVP